LNTGLILVSAAGSAAKEEQERHDQRASNVESHESNIGQSPRRAAAKVAGAKNGVRYSGTKCPLLREIRDGFSLALFLSASKRFHIVRTRPAQAARAAQAHPC
jgi:hypothetical protein